MSTITAAEYDDDSRQVVPLRVLINGEPDIHDHAVKGGFLARGEDVTALGMFIVRTRYVLHSCLDIFVSDLAPVSVITRKCTELDLDIMFFKRICSGKWAEERSHFMIPGSTRFTHVRYCKGVDA
ncbi:hypothetical protein [Streptomyces sp. NPDC001422]|uniref:hypothetical protein n=1 Tax=Streptomyces sp. NPDC001422 TaxID=3364575 RepID=UPI0036896127